MVDDGNIPDQIIPSEPIILKEKSIIKENLEKSNNQQPDKPKQLEVPPQRLERVGKQSRQKNLKRSQNDMRFEKE